MMNISKLKNILASTTLEPTEDLKKNCGAYVGFQEVVHLECSNMGKSIFYLALRNVSFYSFFSRTFPQLSRLTLWHH